MGHHDRPNPHNPPYPLDRPRLLLPKIPPKSKPSSSGTPGSATSPDWATSPSCLPGSPFCAIDSSPPSAPASSPTAKVYSTLFRAKTTRYLLLQFHHCVDCSDLITGDLSGDFGFQAFRLMEYNVRLESYGMLCPFLEN